MPAMPEALPAGDKNKKKANGATAQPNPEVHMVMEALVGLQHANAGILQCLDQLEV